MSQVVGSSTYQYSGIQLCAGVNGPVCIFAGLIDPRTFSDPSSNGRVTVNSADVPTLFLLNGVGWLEKNGFDASGNTSGSWTLK